MNAWLCLERLSCWDFSEMDFTFFFMLFSWTCWTLWHRSGWNFISLKAWGRWFKLYLWHMSHRHLIDVLHSNAEFLSCWVSSFTAWSLIFFVFLPLLYHWSARLIEACSSDLRQLIELSFAWLSFHNQLDFLKETAWAILKEIGRFVWLKGLAAWC